MQMQMQSGSNMAARHLQKELFSSRVPSTVPSGLICRKYPCELYSRVTMPFSWGSVERRSLTFRFTFKAYSRGF